MVTCCLTRLVLATTRTLFYLIITRSQASPFGFCLQIFVLLLLGLQVMQQNALQSTLSNIRKNT